MTNITIQLDVTHEYYDTPEYKFDLIEFLVADKLIELYGPAGGNPLVELTASESNLRGLLASWQFDADEIEYLLEA